MKLPSFPSRLIGALFLGLGLPAAAEPWSIDAARSHLEVFVPKAGLFSFAGHEHTIVARTLEGRMRWAETDAAPTALSLRIPVASLAVTDTKLSAGDRAKVEETMRSPTVLDAARQEVITFAATRIEAREEGTWQVTGDLAVAGRGAEVLFSATVDHEDADTLRAQGTLSLPLATFDIQPVTALGGTIRTGKTVEIRFDVILQPEAGRGTSPSPRP
jgi:polyisoprenoid-binding protein YceI